jgi:chromosome segregation ATPase
MSLPVTGVKAINLFKSLAPKVGGFAALLTTAQVYESKGRETYADIAQTYIENVMAQLEAVVIFGLTKTNSKRLNEALNHLADSGDTAGDITEQLNTWRDEIPDDVRVDGDRLLALTEEISKALKLADEYETAISAAENNIARKPDADYERAISEAKNEKQRLDERIEQLRQERDNLNADLAHIENQKWAALIYYITIKLDLLSGGGTGA